MGGRDSAYILGGGFIFSVFLLLVMYAALKSWPPRKRKRAMSTSEGFFINALTVAIALSATAAAGTGLSQYQRTHSSKFGTWTLMIVNAYVAIVTTFFAYTVIFMATGDDQGI